jgi:hypothetical protein
MDCSANKSIFDLAPQIKDAAKVAMSLLVLSPVIKLSSYIHEGSFQLYNPVPITERDRASCHKQMNALNQSLH